MKELLVYIAQSLVEHPEAVSVDETETEYGLVLDLHVHESDMGKVIGKQGKIAKAIRSVVKAAASKENIKVTVNIV
ncbi:MAG: KH domain-containing protein [Clostridia bacterium]|nr:KH domain-containing protein [Clostridia bacterium]